MKYVAFHFHVGRHTMAIFQDDNVRIVSNVRVQTLNSLKVSGMCWRRLLKICSWSIIDAIPWWKYMLWNFHWRMHPFLAKILYWQYKSKEGFQTLNCMVHLHYFHDFFLWLISLHLFYVEFIPRKHSVTSGRCQSHFIFCTSTYSKH